MCNDAYALDAKLPYDTDAIVGVPRSGMIAASLLAVHRHVALYTITASGVQKLSSGKRGRSFRDGAPRTVAVIEDTVCSGHSLALAISAVREAFPTSSVFPATVYLCPGKAGAKLVKAWSETRPVNMFQQWSFFNASDSRLAAMDIDGILCRDPPRGAENTEASYIAWLRAAVPLYHPVHHPVAAIVTARLDRYRQPTEEWLAKHRVRFKQLVMGPWKTKEERSGKVAAWKAAVYRSLALPLFVESSPRQAKAIADVSGKPVLCPAVRHTFGLGD